MYQGQGPALTKNLGIAKPSNWNDKIPIGITQLPSGNQHSYSGPYYANQTFYTNWNSTNLGTATIDGYTVRFEVSGQGGGSWDWTGLKSEADRGIWLVNDKAIGPLSVGSHTFTVRVDPNNAIAETNESDNVYSRTINVTVDTSNTPDLTPYKPSNWSGPIVVSASTGANTDTALTTDDTVYVDWAVINQGTAPTAATHYVALYVDGTQVMNWSCPSPIAPHVYSYVQDYSLGRLGGGSHTLRIVADTGNAVTEISETNNQYTKTITVSSNSGGCSGATLAKDAPPLPPGQTVGDMGVLALATTFLLVARRIRRNAPNMPESP